LKREKEKFFEFSFGTRIGKAKEISLKRKFSQELGVISSFGT